MKKDTQQISNKEILDKTKEVIKYLCGDNHDLTIELNDSPYCDPLIIIDCVACIGWETAFEHSPYPFWAGKYIVSPRNREEAPTDDVTRVSEFYSWKLYGVCVYEALKVILQYRLAGFQISEQERDSEESAKEFANLLNDL